MKKAKIALVAIVLLGGVAGAYAFKATRNSALYCTNVPNTTGVLKLSVAINPTGLPNTYCTTTATAIAPLTATIFNP